MTDDRVTLCNGDFSIRTTGENTRLTAITPVTSGSPQVVRGGDYHEWGKSKWNELIRRVETWGRNDLQRELTELKNHVLKERILGESPVFNDDESRGPRAVHTLELHHSRERDYVTVRGTATHPHAERLEDLGLDWDPRDGEWRTDFSPDALGRIREFVEKNDHTYDPREIGYSKCQNCGRWKPEEKQCRCHSATRSRFHASPGTLSGGRKVREHTETEEVFDMDDKFRTPKARLPKKYVKLVRTETRRARFDSKIHGRCIDW